MSPETAGQIKISFGYKHYVQLIQTNLQAFYGNRADWNRCIQKYFHSREYQGQCHVPQSCEEIPLITTGDLRKMMDEEEQFHAHREEFLALYKKIHNSSSHNDLQDLLYAASLLGILPSQSGDGLYHWLILRDGMTEEEQQSIEAAIRSDPGRLASILRLFYSILIPGALLTFPSTEAVPSMIMGKTAMTQSPNRYFYRGESAYYGSSRPSMYRFGDSGDPVRMQARQLTIEEACFFLRQFDAVKRWEVSGVNYLALAQHYGVPTPMMDLTSDLKTALFFACCKYEHHRWRPLNRKDFAVGSGSKDPRYGIVYRSPTEITSMKWALSASDSAKGFIIPIGYQPFMRCSAQHGYMLLADNEHYDMLKDPLFDKFRFEHDEWFCRWIFKKMDGGAKVYPLDDVPDIEPAMEKIGSSHIISSRSFATLHLSEAEARHKKELLCQAGYQVQDRPKAYITAKKLLEINRQYSCKVALQKLDFIPVSSPIGFLPSDCLVDENQMVLPSP